MSQPEHPSQPSGKRSPRWPPRIIFNTDGCLVFKYLKRRNPNDVTEMLVPLAQTSVDVISVLVGIDDDLSWRGSPHAELYGDSIGDNVKDLLSQAAQGQAPAVGMNMMPSDLLRMNLAAMVDDGHDVLQVYIDRARQVGLGIFASYRMNVGNCNNEHRISTAGRSALKLSRPDLLIGSPTPVMEDRADVWKFCWQWDYAQPEVRQRFLGLFDETLTRYDFDGLELDFCRSPLLFKPGQAYKHVSTMTDFMRTAREIVRRHGVKKGKDIKLVCRLPTSIDHSMEVGIDTEAWIREGLVDVAVIASPLTSQLEMDVPRAVVAARDSGVLVYAGFDSATDTVSPQGGYELNPPTVARAIALNGYRQGATGVHLFNGDYSAHRPQPVSEDDSSDMPVVERPPMYQGLTDRFDTDRLTRKDLQTLRDLGDPQALEGLDRCYYLSGDKYSGDFRPQLPRRLALVGRGAGPAYAMHLTVEDDVAGGLVEGRIKKTELRLRLTEHERSMDRIRCEVNGERVDLAAAREVENSSGQEWLVVDNPPVHQGDNTVLVVLGGSATPEGAWLEERELRGPWPILHQCEVLVKCQREER